MLEHVFPVYADGIPGELASLDCKVVAPFKRCVYSQRAYGFYNRGREAPEHFRSILRIRSPVYESEVYISEVMEYRPSAGQPSDNRYFVFLYVISVDFGHGILVSPDYYGGGVPPEPEYEPGYAAGKHADESMQGKKSEKYDAYK